MSDIKIKSEKDLMKFLKIVAQESYSRSLNESYLDYEQQYDYDEDRFGKLSAISKKKLDEEEEDESGLFGDADEEDDLARKPERDQQENPIEDEESAKTTASLDTVADRINRVRAGRSTKDKEIKAELENYYNELDENERELLVLYLNSIAEILGGDVEGIEAKEPSDPPEQYKITTGEEEADADAEADAAATAPSEEEGGLFSGEEEDTSPPEDKEDLPVAVNERKSDWELRMKVRELMER